MTKVFVATFYNDFDNGVPEYGLLWVFDSKDKAIACMRQEFIAQVNNNIYEKSNVFFDFDYTWLEEMWFEKLSEELEWRWIAEYVETQEESIHWRMFEERHTISIYEQVIL